MLIEYNILTFRPLILYLSFIPMLLFVYLFGHVID